MTKNLSDVTVVAITTKDYASTISAIKKTLEHITPAEVILFTDIPFQDDDFDNIVIPRFDTWKAYNEFLCREVYKYVETSHILIIQHDGFVLDGSVWTDAFLMYDYIGAPWMYKDGCNVGNGGFSLRSKRLMEIVGTDKLIESNGIYYPEDNVICRLYRPYLEKTYDIKYAPDHVAHKFSHEMWQPWQKTFGFHGTTARYREPIILKRSYGMGDVLMMEPLMQYLHDKGYLVVLDTDPGYMGLFDKHFFPVAHISQFDNIEGIRTINLDQAYEIKPRQLALKSYYESCGITDGELVNPKLNFPVDDFTRIYNKYVVIHADDTGMPHRNVHGVNWDYFVEALEIKGYTVCMVGSRVRRVKNHFNTSTKSMLMYLIAGAEYFIGIDSGPSQIAVALGVKSIIFFGSVDPRLRYANLDNIRVIQKGCPIEKNGCYHSKVGSEVGVDCEVDVKQPPCITHATFDAFNEVMDAIKSF